MAEQTTQYESEQIVTYKPFMASLLRRLQLARVLTRVQLNKKQTSYNSLVLNVDAANSLFYLDELSPLSAHQSVRKGIELKLIGQLQGVYIEFVTRVKRIENNGSIAMYQISFPDKLIYRQRRRHYRANVDETQNIRIAFPDNFQKKIQGEIVDISASGVCSKLEYVDSKNLEARQAIHDATLRLPGSNYLTLDMEVCNIRHFPEKGYSLVGTRFIDIEPKQQNHVDRIVAMLDRSQRRSAAI